MSCSGCLKTIARGIHGTVRVVTRQDPATRVVVQGRLAICCDCDQLLFGMQCRSCKCVVQVKARDAAEVCPEGKW